VGQGRTGLTDYILEHHQRGERDRLALMAQLFDPMHRRWLELVGVGPGTEALEVGCGNGSIAAWLGGRTAPGGRVVAVDIDLSLIEGTTPNVEFRKGDILKGPVEQAGFDLVTARAVLHHLPDVERAISNLVASVRPGGAILLIEPDFLPVSVAEPPDVRAFWDAWLSWARRHGVDYHLGRRLPGMLASAGLEQIEAAAETALYNGGSAWARYFQETMVELRERLLEADEFDERLIDSFLARCDDPSWWTQTVAMTAVRARVAPS
jgi:SAM-dependent methyltransferase